MEVSVGSGGMEDQDPWVNAPLRMGHPESFRCRGRAD